MTRDSDDRIVAVQENEKQGDVIETTLDEHALTDDSNSFDTENVSSDYEFEIL